MAQAVIQLAQAVIKKNENSVCPSTSITSVFFSFFSLCQLGYVRLHQVTSGYVSLRQFTLEGRDVELDNLQRFYKCNIIQ